MNATFLDFSMALTNFLLKLCATSKRVVYASEFYNLEMHCVTHDSSNDDNHNNNNNNDNVP